MGTAHHHAVAQSFCVCVCVCVVSLSVFAVCVHGDVLRALSHVAADAVAAAPIPMGETVCTIPASLFRPSREVTERGPKPNTVPLVCCRPANRRTAFNSLATLRDEKRLEPKGLLAESFARLLGYLSCQVGSPCPYSNPPLPCSELFRLLKGVICTVGFSGLLFFFRIFFLFFLFWVV